MKLENLKKINKIAERIEANEKALSKIESLLSSYTGNNDGSCPDKPLLYDLHLSKHEDGSGFSVDLTGSMIQIQILQFAAKELEKQINLDKESLVDL